MTELILGQKLIDKYNILPIDLINYIQKGELSPKTYLNCKVCRPDRKPTGYIQSLESRLHSLGLEKVGLKCKDNIRLNFLDDEPIPAVRIKQIDEEIQAIEAELKALKENCQDPYDWQNYSLPLNKREANDTIEFLCSCYYLVEEICNANDGKGLENSSNQDHYLNDKSNRKNPLPCQKHKRSVIKVAKAIWLEHPTVTIAEMAHLDAINCLCDGKVYSEKTIRNWIKDYCPNRAPGRRSATKQV